MEADELPRKRAKGFMEPAEAADTAEELLKTEGVPGVSFAEIRYNGDKEPHTVVFYMEADTYGVWNTNAATWPIFYSEDNPYGIMLAGNPFADAEGGDEHESDFGDFSEDSDKLDLSEDAAEADDDGDDATEDDDAEDEIDVPDEDDESEDEIEDEDEDTDEEEEDEDEDENDDESDSDASSDDSDSESDDGEDESDDDEDEEEAEMPRLKIFAKLRGPLGWRKRAEAEELQERNVFSMKLGVVNEEAEKPAKQEAETFAEITFVERDEQRGSGNLILKLPEGITPEDFIVKGRTIQVELPYRQEG